MTSSVTAANICAFVPQHNPSKSRVFALVREKERHSGFAGLEAVATISEAARADALSAALNQYMYDRDEALGFRVRLRAVLADEPESVNAAIQQVLDRVKASEPVNADSPVRGISPFGSFPISACPADGCPACGDCVDSCRECRACDEYADCDCSVPMPPRTASLIHAAAEIYCDEVHDRADEISSGAPLRPHGELWPIPHVASWQSRKFYRRFARAFEDIARDIEGGDLPEPHTMAEEIALHLALDRAAEMVAEEGDEFELFAGGMPESRFDFDFDMLHDSLFEDKDYEYAYLAGRTTVAKPGDLDEWFEDFRSSAPRSKYRGFHR
ncbi:hypothetical protein [Actinomadura violacea]|uniref:4Fe-4S ferredoxin-type domain-containing protein n=1 Tax=Actinomadura violacea TaxID=2819934 RepID=A0ABS3RMY3_9ACTN|nr:hypothetical protein [Actinomadura violacea]MBO2458114.1 hypothetical protein [Actinomadura violacea]